MEATHEVAIIDDDAHVRSDVAHLLGSIGIPASTYRSAEEFLSDHPSDAGCVVTEMRMPGMSGLQLQQEMASRDMRVPLIMLTAFADVPAAVRSMKAGAFDLIEKPFSPQLLIDTVHSALRQAETSRRERDESADVRARYESLTPRERQVLRLVAGGVSNKNVARQLGLSEKTVEFHRAKVMAKMRAESVAELVRLSLLCPSPAPAEHLPAGRPVYRELGGEDRQVSVVH
jgi:FixJ family two-component response regulator